MLFASRLYNGVMARALTTRIPTWLLERLVALFLTLMLAWMGWISYRVEAAVINGTVLLELKERVDRNERRIDGLHVRAPGR